MGYCDGVVVRKLLLLCASVSLAYLTNQISVIGPYSTKHLLKHGSYDFMYICVIERLRDCKL